MNAQEIRKMEKVRAMSTEALQHISDTAAGPEIRERSAEFPLGGLVHISGIGQVPLRTIRSILAEKTKETA